jgi:AAA15 family ATPase/GTPase
MWISRLELENIRAFSKQELEFTRGINLFIGANNAGKSSILKPILNLQEGLPTLSYDDVRAGEISARAQLTILNYDGQKIKINHNGNIRDPIVKLHLEFRLNKRNNTIHNVAWPNQTLGNGFSFNKSANTEPNNAIYPFLSKRKVTTLKTNVAISEAEHVSQNFEQLNAKIDRLTNPTFLPGHEFYKKACKEVLKFEVYTSQHNQGKHATYTIRNNQHISLLSMGEGVMNIVALIADLSLAENAIFVIEEPENDIHPKALKKLMEFIKERASNNQFFITTHSNIVLKSLGAVQDAKIYEVNGGFENKIPTATVQELITSEDKKNALEALGYDVEDYDLWKGWLFFEESSAEKIVRDYLIPWFFPRLKSSLKTFSSGGVDKLSKKFDRFDELFIFLHQQPIYQNKAWAFVDAGERESSVLGKLKEKYTSRGWNEDRFYQLTKHSFEEYYPSSFSEDTQRINQITDKQEKREEKKALLERVEVWICGNEAAAKEAFEASAAEIITVLGRINATLLEE